MWHLLGKICTFPAPSILESMNITNLAEASDVTKNLPQNINKPYEVRDNNNYSVSLENHSLSKNGKNFDTGDYCIKVVKIRFSATEVVLYNTSNYYRSFLT